MRRRGFFLPGVLVAALLLLLLAASRLFFSRQHLNHVARLADREAAYQLAEGGLLVARARVDDLLAYLADRDPATFPKRERAPAPLRDLARGLLDGDGRLRPDAGPVGLDGGPFAPLLAACGAGAALAVEVRVGPAVPLYTGEGPGVQPDPREVRLLLRIRAAGVRNGVPCALQAVRPFKVVSDLPPVVGKFTLFLREQGRLKLNGLLDTDTPDRLRETPCVLRHGDPFPAGGLGPGPLRDHIDRQGWVFLGGPRRWTLNLSKGGGRPEYEEDLIRKGRFSFPIPPGPLADVPGLAFFSSPDCLYRELILADRGSPFGLLKLESVGMTSILNLAGSTAAPSPTLALGDVARRYALIQGLVNEGSDEWAPLPWLTAAAFAGDEWPGGHAPGTVRAIREQFGGRYADYARRMSDLVEEPWNAGNLNALTRDDPALAGIPFIDPLAPPPGFTPPPPSLRLAVDGRPAPLLSPLLGGEFLLRDTAGRVLYRGGPLDGLADLAFLAAKAGKTYATAADFFAAGTAAGGFPADGVVLVDGPLDLAGPLRVGAGRGGLLLVRGDLRIGAGIDCAPGETLALVSLAGALEIDTDATLECALVALAGPAVVRRGLNLRGLLGARDLAFEKPDAAAGRRIDYDPAFDPTDAANADRHLRLVAGGEWLTYVE